MYYNTLYYTVTNNSVRYISFMMEKPKSLKDRIKKYKTNGFKPIRENDLNFFRKVCRNNYLDLRSDFPNIVAEDIRLNSQNGRPIYYRHYTHRNISNNHCVIYIFGGGFIEGDLDSQDSICRFIASQSRVDVLAISYSLAPEYVYPAAHSDIYEGILHLIQNYDYFYFHILGYSSGGNLALSAILNHIKNQVCIDKIKSLILIAPLLNLDKPRDHHIEDVMLDIEDIYYMISLYTNHTGVDLKSPHISPYYEEDHNLKKLPETTVLSMAYDPISFDLYPFHRRLCTLGVSSKFYEYSMIHLEFNLSIILKQLIKNPLEDCCQILNSTKTII